MDKIVYALNLIVDFIDASDIVDEKTISEYLFFTGFDDYEIRQVMSVLDMEGMAAEGYFRFFSKTEKSRFSPEALGYLNKLTLCGVLDFNSAENVMEKAENGEGYKVGIDRIKELTLMALLEKKAGIAGDEGPREYIQ